MSWMPEDGKLPSNVHMVVSTLPKEHGILQALQTKYSANNQHLFLEVTSLDTQVSCIFFNFLYLLYTLMVEVY